MTSSPFLLSLILKYIGSVLHYVLKSRMFVRMFAQGDEEIFL